MFANLIDPQEAEASCACFVCFLYGPSVICHSRWRPQAPESLAEGTSG